MMKKGFFTLTLTSLCATTSVMAMELLEDTQPVGQRFVLVPKNEVVGNYTCGYQLVGPGQPTWLKKQIPPESAFEDEDAIKKPKKKDQSRYKTQGYSRKESLCFEIIKPEEQAGHLTSAIQWVHVPYCQLDTSFQLIAPEYFLQSVYCAGVIHINLNEGPCHTEGNNQYYIGHISKSIIDPFKDVPKDIELWKKPKFRKDFTTDEEYQSYNSWHNEVEYEQAKKWEAAEKNFKQNTLNPLKKEVLQDILASFPIPLKSQEETAIETKQEALSHQLELDLQPIGNAQSITKNEQGTKVITDNNNHASYQLESDWFDVAMGQEIQIPYHITVENGGIMSLGLLNTARNGWYGEELILKAGSHRGTYERIVPEGETVTSLVFRNYHLGTPGQTIFTIKETNFVKK